MENFTDKINFYSPYILTINIINLSLFDVEKRLYDL